MRRPLSATARSAAGSASRSCAPCLAERGVAGPAPASEPRPRDTVTAQGVASGEVLEPQRLAGRIPARQLFPGNRPPKPPSLPEPTTTWIVAPASASLPALGFWLRILPTCDWSDTCCEVCEIEPLKPACDRVCAASDGRLPDDRRHGHRVPARDLERDARVARHGGAGARRRVGDRARRPAVVDLGDGHPEPDALEGRRRRLPGLADDVGHAQRLALPADRQQHRGARRQELPGRRLLGEHAADLVLVVDLPLLRHRGEAQAEPLDGGLGLVGGLSLQVGDLDGVGAAPDAELDDAARLRPRCPRWGWW